MMLPVLCIYNQNHNHIYSYIYILHHIVYAIYVIFYKHLETPVQGH